MSLDIHIGRRLVSVFLLGALLFNYPLLDLFNRPRLVFGLPILYLYLFGSWSLIIFLVHLICRGRPDGPLPPNYE